MARPTASPMVSPPASPVFYDMILFAFWLRFFLAIYLLFCFNVLSSIFCLRFSLFLDFGSLFAVSFALGLGPLLKVFFFFVL